MKSRWFLVLVALGLMVAVGCGEDAGGGDGNGDGGNNDAGGPANQVDAQIEGGSAQGPVEGESEQSAPMINQGAVTDGALVVTLTSEAGVVFFRLDSGTGQMPGSFQAGRDLDGAAYLTFTTAAGGAPAIYESNGGRIRVDGCPNTTGTVVTGSFQDVALLNTITEAPDGTLSGSFRVTIVQSDGSADCAPEPANNDANNDVEGPSPGPSCPNPTCDGPCCPYLPDLLACSTSCFNDLCQNPATFLECAQCLDGCPREVGMLDDAACAAPFNELGQCIQRNGCEGDLEDDPCIANNCCEPYRATF